MTLTRIAGDSARLRSRVSRIEISAAAGGMETISARAFVARPLDILLRSMDQRTAARMMRHMSAWLEFDKSTDGEIRLEVVADPRDPAQAETLVKALRGDFEEFFKPAGLPRLSDSAKQKAELSPEWNLPD